MALFNFLPSFRTKKHKRGADKRRAKAAPRADLHIESLEDRLVMTASVISGFVYADVNNNGIYDVGEKPIANSSIQLQNSQGVAIGQTVTDANGFYQFTTDSTISTLPAILAKSATIPTTATDWTQSLTIPQFDPALGTLTSIDVVNAGTFTSSIKVESLDGGPSIIIATVSGNLTLTGNGVSGLVTTSSSSKNFSAAAFDGLIDFGGASGNDFGSPSTNGSNTLTLSDAASLAAYTGLGNLTFIDVAHATSSASGAGNLLTQIGTTANAQIQVVYHYIPSNAIKPGNYVIVQTVEPAGYIDGKESSAGVVIPNSIGTDTIPVVFNGSSSTDNDFGELKAASVAGNVYVDTNNNGIKDVNEAGIAGVTLTLTGADDVGPVSRTTTTAADGSYVFANLRPGAYGIKETQPAAYLDGKDSLGSLGGTVSNDLFSNIALSSGANGINYNFGELPPSSLAGKVYADANNNGAVDPGEVGIGSVTLTLTGADDLGNPVTATTTTAADGSYVFGNLRPGTYSIKETQPAAYFDGKDTLGSLGGTVSNDLFSNIGLSSGVNGINYNFGELPPSSLAGKVYADANNNGALDPGEVGIGAVTVTLTGTDDLGNPVTAATTTAADGSYVFGNLRPGTYSIKETQPAAYFDGKDSLGSQGGTVSNDLFSNIALSGGANGINYNFGELLASSIAGKVYYDANNSGALDQGETGIGAVTLTLTGTDDLGNPVSATTTTAADGTYKFGNLRPGTYQIVETQPANYIDGKATAGSVGGTVGINLLGGIPLPASTNAVSYNFGELKLGSLSGIVWFDANQSGTIDSGDSAIPGVTITLTGVDDLGHSVTLTTTTAPDGNYAFNGLRPGSYAITETQPDHFLDGAQLLGSLGGQVALNQFLNIPLQPAQSGVQYDFGEINKIDNIITPPPPFVPINIDVTFLSKLQLLSNSQQILAQATQLAYYVDGVYTVTLGRHADMGGLNFFTFQLLLGTQTRQSFVSYMMNTPEHFALQVNAAFSAILGRQADAGGLNYYMGLLASGVSLNDLDATLLASSEFQGKSASNQAYVQTIFQRVLGRSASSADLAFWTGQLNGGQPRINVVEAILHSSESIAQDVNEQYQSILGRLADTPSLNQWVSMIQSGQISEPQLENILLCSSEFYTRVLVAAHLI
jgi:protocatechuate 3,4-dioxygenase beta subunit